MFRFLLKMKLKFFFLIAILTVSLISMKMVMKKINSWVNLQPISADHGIVDVIQRDIKKVSVSKSSENHFKTFAFSFRFRERKHL